MAATIAWRSLITLLLLVIAPIFALPVDDLRDDTAIQFAHRRLNNDQARCDVSNSAHWSLSLETAAGAKKGTLSGCHSKVCMPIFDNIANYDDEIRRGTVKMISAGFANSTDVAGQHGMGTKHVTLFEKPYCQHEKSTARLRQGQSVTFSRPRVFRSFMVENAGLYWTNGDSHDQAIGMGMTEGKSDGEEWWEDIHLEDEGEKPLI